MNLFLYSCIWYFNLCALKLFQIHLSLCLLLFVLILMAVYLVFFPFFSSSFYIYRCVSHSLYIKQFFSFCLVRILENLVFYNNHMHTRTLFIMILCHTLVSKSIMNGIFRLIKQNIYLDAFTFTIYTNNQEKRHQSLNVLDI